MRNTLLLLLLIFAGTTLRAQNPVMDKLEMLYAQGHYKRVLRKANQLLDKPEYDASLLPLYYRALSQIQLAQNLHWFKRQPDLIDEVRTSFQELRTSNESHLLFDSHVHELNNLHREMIAWASDLSRMGEKHLFEEVQGLISSIFGTLPLELDDAGLATGDLPETIHAIDHVEIRNSIVNLAKEQLGVPYQWAGSSPQGFDCSGFTSYILDQIGKEIPRRAADQHESSKKIKEKQVQPGDLVFFSNGSTISHVGIVLSGPGDPLIMIHSSSSQGIVITNVANSEYWSKRLYGFGTFVF